MRFTTTNLGGALDDFRTAPRRSMRSKRRERYKNLGNLSVHHAHLDQGAPLQDRSRLRYDRSLSTSTVRAIMRKRLRMTRREDRRQARSTRVRL